MIRLAWSWMRGAGGNPSAQSRSHEAGAWIKAVYLKETLEAFRDRRSLLVLIVLPAFIMPVVTLGIPYLEQRQQHQISTTTPEVAVVGQAPNLVHLAYTSKLVTPVHAADAAKALRERQVLAVLEIPPSLNSSSRGRRRCTSACSTTPAIRRVSRRAPASSS
jgi:hypothetical protein